MNIIKKIALPLIWVVLLFLVFFLYKEILVSNTNSEPNFILISIDTLRQDHMGVYGYKRDTTPNIDKWAQDAAIFTNAYTIIPETYPSFAALMTGRYPVDTKITSNRSGDIPMNRETLAETFKKRGYATGASVTSGVLSGSINNINRGFDYFGTNRDSEEISGSFNYMKRSFDWIFANKTKPLFFWFHIKAPHRPYYPPLQFRNIFSKSSDSPIKGFKLEEARDKQDKLADEFTCYEPSKRLDGLIDSYVRLYDEDILNGDTIFQYIIDQLDASGLTKNSIIVFYGDHGEGFDHNYYFNHGKEVYNSNIKIPLIIKLPTNERGVINDVVDNTSIYNIMKDLPLNLNKPFFIFPNHLRALVKNFTKNNVFVAANNIGIIGLVGERYKYIRNIRYYCPSNPQEEFYDLYSDKTEDNNLMGKQEYKEIIDTFKSNFLNNNYRYFPPQNEETIDLQKNQGQQEKEEKQEKTDILKSLGY